MDELSCLLNDDHSKKNKSELLTIIKCVQKSKSNLFKDLYEHVNHKIAEVEIELSTRIKSLEDTNQTLQKEIASLKENEARCIEMTLTAAKTEIERIKPIIVKETSEHITNEQLEKMKPELISETVNLVSKKQETTSISPIYSGKEPDVVIFGIKENEQPSAKERHNKLKEDVVQCIKTLNATPEDVITNYYRIGKFDKTKSRPIGIKVNSVWTKRKLISEYSKLQNEGVNLKFTLKESIRMTPKFNKAKKRAMELNKEAKTNALNNNLECNISYSPRPDGTVMVFKKTGNKWNRIETLDMIDD